MTFENRLYELRKQSGLSQEELAGEVGVSRQAVQKWESGASTPDIQNLAALCDYFGVTMDYLVRGVNAQEPPMPEEPAPVPPVYYRNHWPFGYEYKSEKTLFGLPLVHVNLGYGIRRAKGIVAIGGVATGVVALGGFSFGFLSLGGFTLGLVALGGFGAGVFAFGGVVLSLLLSIGGVAVSGGYALGGLAVAVKAAYGGAAVAREIAIGGESAIGRVALTHEALAHMTAEQVRQVVLSELPRAEQWLVRMIERLAGR